MKRFLYIASLAIFTVLLATGVGLAQESESIDVADLFTWATITPVNWGQGITFAVLGLVGALVTIFGLVGGAVPGTAGQAKLQKESVRLETLSDRLVELATSPPPDAEVIGKLQETVDNLRDDLRTERWRQFGIAAILYAVLGAFFSAMLAQDILQALVIGAGWTGLLGTLGLKRDYAERKSIKDSAMERIITRAREVEEKLPEEEVASRMPQLEPFSLIEKEARIAQKL